MKDCRIKVINQELSALIQKRLFELGCEWVGEWPTTISFEPVKRYGRFAQIHVERNKMTFSDEDTTDGLPILSIEELFTLPLNEFYINDVKFSFTHNTIQFDRAGHLTIEEIKQLAAKL